MFKKGDIVIGLPNNDYRVTGAGSICEVIKMMEGNSRMVVKLIKTRNPHAIDNEHAKYTGSIYTVRCNKFILEKGNVNHAVAGLLRKGDMF